MPSFVCTVCGAGFDVPASAIQKYPNWKPRYCREHSPKTKGRARSSPRRGRRNTPAPQPNRTVAEVLALGGGGPQDGLFTDGSCQPNPGPGGWGVVWVRDGQILAQRHGREGQTTNNRMELMAVIKALESLKKDQCNIRVTSDSKYVLKGINEWMENWKKRGWKTSAKKPVKNIDLWQRLDKAREIHNIEWVWVKGHSGHIENEIADELANQGIDEL